MINKAVEDAYLIYARPMKNFKSNVDLKPSHRLIHGIGHALGVMELIPDILALYPEDPLKPEVIAFFGSKEKLVECLQIVALFHDSARQGDGVDYWYKQSSENAMYFLQTYDPKMDKDLVRLLGLIGEYKDNPYKYRKQMPKKFQAISHDLSILRELVHAADQLEVIRVRNNFDLKYVHSRLKENKKGYLKLLQKTYQKVRAERRGWETERNYTDSNGQVVKMVEPVLDTTLPGHDKIVMDRLKSLYGFTDELLKSLSQEDPNKRLSGYDGFKAAHSVDAAVKKHDKKTSVSSTSLRQILMYISKVIGAVAISYYFGFLAALAVLGCLYALEKVVGHFGAAQDPTDQNFSDKRVGGCDAGSFQGSEWYQVRQKRHSSVFEKKNEGESGPRRDV